jgi:hypothetical protein
MVKKSSKARARARRRSKQRRQRLIWIGGIAAVLALLGLLIWPAVRPAAGQSVPIQSAAHVPEGTDPGKYSTDPPTSGPHYAEHFEAGFFEEADLASLPDYPVGYLVHNLEHGYVIFWYNCKALREGSCEGLKTEIRSVMDRHGGTKLIAFPWESIEVPVVMTSWGRIQRFEAFNLSAASRFVRRNRYRAPEPDAP